MTLPNILTGYRQNLIDAKFLPHSTFMSDNVMVELWTKNNLEDIVRINVTLGASNIILDVQMDVLARSN